MESFCRFIYTIEWKKLLVLKNNENIEFFFKFIILFYTFIYFIVIIFQKLFQQP